MSSGAKVVSAIAVQADKDTIPQSGWKILPVVSNGLTVSTSLTESETIAGGRIAKSGMVTGGEISGDIETELMFGVYDDLLAAAFWSDWVVGATGAPDTLKIGSTKKMFAVTKDFTDINVNHIFKDCVVNSLSLEVDAESLVKVKFGMMGLGYASSDATSFAKSPTATPDGKKASGLSIGTIKVDGAQIGVCVEAFKFELDNQAEVQKCLGDNIYGGNILAMLANASGSLTLAYSQAAHNIIKEQLTGRTFSLEVPIQFDTKKYVIKIPKMQVSGEIPNPSGKDLVTVDVNYTVVDESPVIERYKA